MYQVTLEDAEKQLPTLIEAVRGGEEIVITRDKEPVARLVSVKQAKPRRVFGSAKGMIQMANDFDAPLDDFKDYM